METISLEPKQFSLNVGIEVAPPIANDVQGANDDNSELRNEHAGRRTDVPSARGTRADPGNHAPWRGSREVFGIRYNQSEKSQKPYMRGTCLCLSAMCPDAGVAIWKG